MPDLFQRHLPTAKWGKQAGLTHFFRQISGFHVFRLLVRALYRFRVEGEAYLPAEGPCIFAMNHESGLSDALVFLTVKRHFPNVHTFAWHQLKGQSPLFDFFRRFGEQAPRERVLKAFKGRGLSGIELVRAHKALEQKQALLITVEGGMTWDGRLLHPFEPGAAWLALRSGAPLVPIVSVGGYDIQPYWRYAKARLRGRLSVRIGEPFRPASAPVSEIDEQMLHDANEQLWQRMADLRAEPDYTPVPLPPLRSTASTTSAGTAKGQDRGSRSGSASGWG